jgi:hypothetical protein
VQVISHTSHDAKKLNGREVTAFEIKSKQFAYKLTITLNSRPALVLSNQANALLHSNRSLKRQGLFSVSGYYFSR